MGSRHLGSQRHQKGLKLEVVCKTPHLLSFTPENFQLSCRLRKRDAKKGCSNSPKGEGRSKSPFFSAQKRHRQTESDTGLIAPQPSHSMSHFQNGLDASSEAGTIQRGVADFSRSEGSLLARPDSKISPEIPSLCHLDRELLLQGHAFWPKYCAKNFHKTLRSDSQRLKRKGSDDFCLPGRLAYCGKVIPGGNRGNEQDPKNTHQCRLRDKRAKVNFNPHTIPVVARTELEHSIGHCRVSRDKDSGSLNNDQDLHIKTALLKKGSRESSGTSQLVINTQPREQSQVEVRKPDPKIFRQEVFKGPDDPHEQRPAVRIEMVEPVTSHYLDSTLYRPSNSSHRHDGCLLDGVGLPHLDGSGGTRPLVSLLEKQTHKRPRVHGGVLSPEIHQASSPIDSSDPIRQYDSGQLFEERWVSEIEPPQSYDLASSEIGGEEGMVFEPVSHSWQLQREGGSAFQGGTSGNRVDPGPGLSKFTAQADVHAPASGLICYQPQPSSTSVCLTDLYERSLGSGCPSPGLGRVGGDLSFSSYSSDFSGFVQTSPVPRRGIAGSTVVAQPGVVPDISSPSQEELQDQSSRVVPDSERYNRLRTALLDRGVTRLDFLSLAYEGAWSCEVVDYFNTSLRPSTGRQYQSAWSKFQQFAIKYQPSEITLDIVFKFLIETFEQKGYQVNTILVYKCALALPLSVAFELNMEDKKFTSLFRSMWLRRPGVPYSSPKWNLDLVLELLSTNRFNINVSQLDLARKSVFLLGLALGNRISEFHSLLRGNRFIKFSRNFKSATFIPNAAFLAKNEAPSFRRKPMTVYALFKRDGSPHALCPVDTLRKYLDMTNHCNSSKLFVNPTTNVPCNKGRIRYLFTSLIRLSQPRAFARFHDLRKFASWGAFWANMTWSSIRARGFWRSNSALGRRYLQGSVPMAIECVALGRASH